MIGEVTIAKATAKAMAEAAVKEVVKESTKAIIKDIGKVLENANDLLENVKTYDSAESVSNADSLLDLANESIDSIGDSDGFGITEGSDFIGTENEGFNDAGDSEDSDNINETEESEELDVSDGNENNGDINSSQEADTLEKSVESVENLNEKDFKNSFADEKKNLSTSEEIKSETNPDSNETKETPDLTDEQKKEIVEKTSWSDEIIDSLNSYDEAKIYMDANLKESEINGKKCLIRDDIDLDQKDEDGISNRDRMKRGQPPITNEGETVELHHIGQKADSPLAELTTEEHRGKGNDSILHDKNKESEINRNEFGKERQDHWKSRVMEQEGN